MSALPSASVVLCTFQGEKFLPEQLASLRAQSVAPKEILARDDASTDSTLSILEQEAKGNPRLVVSRNDERMGFAQNFARACREASGDVVFFCDQDDVWERDKLELMLARFAKNPRLELACSEAVFLGTSELVLQGNGLTDAEVRSWELGGAFPFLLRRNPVPGMTMAVRRDFLHSLLPVPAGWEHDYWILLLASGLGKPIEVEQKPLVRYRRHRGQALGGRRSFLQRWRAAGNDGEERLKRDRERAVSLLSRLTQSGAPAEVLALAGEKAAHLQRRCAFSRWRMVRTVEIAMEYSSGGYHRFDAGLSSAVKDWLASS